MQIRIQVKRLPGSSRLRRLVLRMKDSTIVVEELGADIAKALNRAVERLHQSVSRQLAKLLTLDRVGVVQ